MVRNEGPKWLMPSTDKIQYIIICHLFFRAVVPVDIAACRQCLCMYVCAVVSAAPVSTATAKAEQTDRQITKVVRVSESDTGLLPLTTVKQSAAADVKTDSQDRVATLTSSDLRSNYHLLLFLFVSLTHSALAVPNCCCSKGSAPYWFNPLFLIFDIRALWRSGMSARAPECQKLKMVG